MQKTLLENKSREECIQYLLNQGIRTYFQFGEKNIYGIFDAVNPDNLTPFVPEPEDLYRLHSLIRKRKVFNVLEFGLGYSTIVMADALMKNKKEYYENPLRPEVRIKNPFTIVCVDSSEYWINKFKDMYSSIVPFFDCIDIQHSKCRVGTFCDQLCHFYDKIPNVITDFIYLDAPSPNDVEGDLNGLSFKNCPERTVMSGDLLRIESTLLPGTLILVAGRTNNARFLKNNFKRNYFYEHSENHDVSLFELLEQPLGKINRSQIDYCLEEGFYQRLEECMQ